MSDSNIDKTNRNRRLLLSTGGAALALGAAGGAKAGTLPTYGVTRARYGTAVEAFLPTAGDFYVLPLSVVNFQDKSGGTSDSTLNADNTITINTSGLYRLCLCVDWPGQHGVDNDLRSYGIRRRKAGALKIAVTPDLIKVPDTDQKLATQDVPGSDPPQTVRYQGAWTPGVIPLGGMVSTDVVMPTAGIVTAGDLALASHTAISDNAIGVVAATALIVNAKVIGADKVRVSLFNPTIAAGINVPAGTLQVVAMNSVETRGESADAWTVLNTATEQLNVGDTLYAVFMSKTPGDYMQTSESVYLQVERWA